MRNAPSLPAMCVAGATAAEHNCLPSPVHHADARAMTTAASAWPMHPSDCFIDSFLLLLIKYHAINKYKSSSRSECALSHRLRPMRLVGTVTPKISASSCTLPLALCVMRDAWCSRSLRRAAFSFRRRRVHRIRSAVGCNRSQPVFQRLERACTSSVSVGLIRPRQRRGDGCRWSRVREQPRKPPSKHPRRQT